MNLLMNLWLRFKAYANRPVSDDMARFGLPPRTLSPAEIDARIAESEQRIISALQRGRVSLHP
jgi:hypothetical protein